MAPAALSRTCALTDFAECVTVARWQQLLADAAWHRWAEAEHLRTRVGSLCVNWSGCAFVAPGPTATYRYRGESTNGLERGVPAVFGLSVLDHTEAPVRFLVQARQLLRAKGLLFLTFACWNAEGPDCAVGHEQRVRIYDARSYKLLIGEARRAGFVPFGGVDWAYHGHKLDDHSLASLVLMRR